MGVSVFENQRTVGRCQSSPSTMFQDLSFRSFGLMAPRQPPLVVCSHFSLPLRVFPASTAFETRPGMPSFYFLPSCVPNHLCWVPITPASGFLILLIPGCHSPAGKMSTEGMAQSSIARRFPGSAHSALSHILGASTVPGSKA